MVQEPSVSALKMIETTMSCTHKYQAIFRTSCILIAVCTLLLTSLSCKSSTAAAEQGVAQFRSQFESGQYHAMYIGADDVLQSKTEEPEFIASMEAIHRQLGTFRSASLRGHKEMWFTDTGLRVILVYDTKFGSGCKRRSKNRPHHAAEAA